MICNLNVYPWLPNSCESEILTVLWSDDRSALIEALLNEYFAWALAFCYPLGDPIPHMSVDAVIARAKAQTDAYPDSLRGALLMVEAWVKGLRDPSVYADEVKMSGGLVAAPALDNLSSFAQGIGLDRFFEITAHGHSAPQFIADVYEYFDCLSCFGIPGVPPFLCREALLECNRRGHC